jgi:tRNA(Ile)-lysidine synthetase-like protein
LLSVWADETRRYCAENDLAFREDMSNPDTVRGLIRSEVLPLLRRIHPAADENLLRALDERETLPPALAELLSSTVGSKRVDLGGGRHAVREYERLWLEHSPIELEGEIRWGPWRIASNERGLKVRTWRPGDRLAGRTRKIQDVFVDAKIPRSERDQWPLVVRGDEVVAVPGIVEAPGIEVTRE